MRVLYTARTLAQLPDFVCYSKWDAFLGAVGVGHEVVEVIFDTLLWSWPSVLN